MNGIKLAAAVRDRWPPIKIVATSGRVKLGVDDLPQGPFFAEVVQPRRSHETASGNDRGLGAAPCNFVKQDPAGMTRDR
jgi:hypothetical protein